MADMFKALLISQIETGFVKEIRDIAVGELPDNDVLIRVHFSSINYKDALSASGNKGVTKKFPHVPGIDAAGVVVKSNNADFLEGASVIVTGFDLGMNTWGGFGAYISVPASWVVPLPEGLTLKEAMSFGTAGLTAGLSVEKIIGAGIAPGAVVVSGATGGVGSMAIAILSGLGFQVTAVSGKKEDDFLTQTLGAKYILGREEFIEKYNRKALSSADFAAGVDTVGGAILSGILKSVSHNGLVASCGNIASADLNTSVFPFIIRGITLTGIDSAMAPMALRLKVWKQLAKDWKPIHLNEMVRDITLQELPEKLDEILQGKARGRYVLRHT